MPVFLRMFNNLESSTRATQKYLGESVTGMEKGVRREMKEVWSFCSIWGSGVDAGRYTDEPWQFQCAWAAVFLLEN